MIEFIYMFMMLLRPILKLVLNMNTEFEKEHIVVFQLQYEEQLQDYKPFIDQSKLDDIVALVLNFQISPDPSN